LADKSIIARGEAFRQLDVLGQAGDAEPVPMPVEEYELLLTIIEKYHPDATPYLKILKRNKIAPRRYSH
jgi:hypothetical protein